MNIYDISKEAGVSIATVSRVLNGNTNVSEKTRQKVLDVMNKCDYTPNVFARGLGLNTMNTIGIMCSDSSDDYLANAVYHLEQELRSHGYDSILCCTGYELSVKQKYMQLLLTKRVDAIILAGSSFLDLEDANNQYIKDASSTIPIMIMNGYLEHTNIYNVVCDDCQAIYDVTTQFIKEDRRRILFLYRSESYSTIQKITGYQKALQEHQIPFDKNLILKCPKDVKQTKQLITELYEKGVSFDAVLTSEDIMGIGAIKFAKEHDIVVPDELSIVGFNNSLSAECCEPELTSIDNKVKRVSTTTVHTLMKVLNHEDVPQKTTILAGLVKRDTTQF